jgi:hypothetical protein
MLQSLRLVVLLNAVFQSRPGEYPTLPVFTSYIIITLTLSPLVLSGYGSKNTHRPVNSLFEKFVSDY